MNHSQPTNANQAIPEITRKLTTSGEPHEDWKFPSWRAAMMNEQAVSTRNAPKMSTWQMAAFSFTKNGVGVAFPLDTGGALGK